MDHQMPFPFMHLSVRVPWHDGGWNGTVCTHPQENTSCLRLKRISEEKDDAQELAVAGKSIADLPNEQWPPCALERGMFMADFEYHRIAKHPLAEFNRQTHGHFRPTPLRYPPYSVASVPFRWMLKVSKDELESVYPLQLDENREPPLNFKNNWWQEKSNQKQLLDCFHSHLQPGSLCFLYAKQVPFVEDHRRVIIGIGRINHIGEAIEYETNGSNDFGASLWETMVQHSIRPDFTDGFIFPYQEIFARVKEQPDFDYTPMIAFAPVEKMLEFSYTSEHVSQDTAIECLITCAEALHAIKKEFEGPWDQCLQWIDERISEIWQARGPFPGLGACLTAFGIKLGNFVAQALHENLTEDQSIWDLVDQLFRDPSSLLPPALVKNVGPELQKAWQSLPPTRRSLFQLLCRFNLTIAQACLLYIPELRRKQGLATTDEQIIENPYLIYEQTRLLLEPVSFWTIDKGMLPDESIQTKYPIPEPSALQSDFDPRRIRAAAIQILEEAAESGHSLLPKSDVIAAIQNLPIPTLKHVHNDIIAIIEPGFSPEIVFVEMAVGERAYQLKRYEEIGSLVRDKIRKRTKGKRHSIHADWRQLLNDQLDKTDGHNDSDDTELDPLEEQARIEKSAILKELAESRFSVLIGPAGTGKTTLLSVLISQAQIHQGGVLLLAPTGKARVRLESVAKEAKIEAYTVAQFLGRRKRYDYQTCRFFLRHEKGEPTPETVIVDEASMLTEDMLGALLESMEGVKRLILAGDPKQLPPIGTGRPFVDIVSYLTPENNNQTFPKVGNGYGQLTIPRRQSEDKDDNDVDSKNDDTGGNLRADLRLAQWFAQEKVAPSEDELFDPGFSFNDSEHLRFIQWEREEELPEILKQVIIEELNLTDETDERQFDISLGGVIDGKYISFQTDLKENGKHSPAKGVENWQILSPVNNSIFGVTRINRFIHQTFRKQKMASAQKRFNRYFPKPMGPEKLVYGDKVINTYNHGRDYIYPKDGLRYIANGEIGLVVGQFAKNASHFNVEFASQPGYTYEFKSSDFSDEGNPLLELAYALTVHKSQGSEFGLVIFIMPKHSQLLSPELLYTALTRQKNRIVILHQGPRTEMLKYASSKYSETARRYTNLFEAPKMFNFKGIYLEDRLIHRTVRGELVRSKSEVIIADLLHMHNLNYTYEKELKIDDDVKLPDFTIEDDDSGTIYYWEHLGMLHDPAYKRRWEAKLAWYRAKGIFPIEEGGNLIITEDDARGGIDSAVIQRIIEELKDDD
ncbi:AAA family ATPase [Heliobacillus mobilis]|uniref:AAA family ATPase n=1 Tax=Heliobacterium mobile TaxID=28064 RepID=A0A6I3SNA6_HELMO|nr:AAA family ATPase [Heliobacterium mobile]MTV50510.1 AAA family ATPase [Heliobacterium mobile]